MLSTARCRSVEQRYSPRLNRCSTLAAHFPSLASRHLYQAHQIQVLPVNTHARIPSPPTGPQDAVDILTLLPWMSPAKKKRKKTPTKPLDLRKTPSDAANRTRSPHSNHTTPHVSFMCLRLPMRMGPTAIRSSNVCSLVPVATARSVGIQETSIVLFDCSPLDSAIEEDGNRAVPCMRFVTHKHAQFVIDEYFVGEYPGSTITISQEAGITAILLQACSRTHGSNMRPPVHCQSSLGVRRGHIYHPHASPSPGPTTSSHHENHVVEPSALTHAVRMTL